ncbi:hypothetical protein Ab1vBOLIVR5_gp151 [Agrobacterium phage OLIVR5]|uniref:Uncharacterized protein n=1 Tax=Agrobacterium phage OLIVR5 TaxID=2723773 RepID=A0A858MT81_9CAUD|nr:hypothetical protein KNU99_gp250 [Agrobacterium phage OLIVR5]QIW87799.1 hypothetical protein Ab1vBOLIVR5_gp151 [Agrobacterium phage OLIVR5]QIW88064.1 hypothetical protein Ab1vBOLIVR6_gp157 [Agrobacterium phage OLIVR6]
MWHIEYEAEVHSRVNRYFRSITTCRFSTDDPYLWWCYDKKKFVPIEETSGQYSNHSEGPRTIKAFKRFLRKHPELKGYEVIFVNRYAGLGATAVWIEEK